MLNRYYNLYVPQTVYKRTPTVHYRYINLRTVDVWGIEPQSFRDSSDCLRDIKPLSALTLHACFDNWEYFCIAPPDIFVKNIKNTMLFYKA